MNPVVASLWKQYNKNFEVEWLADTFYCCVVYLLAGYFREGWTGEMPKKDRVKDREYREAITLSAGRRRDNKGMIKKIIADLDARPSVFYTIKKMIGKELCKKYFRNNLQDIREDIDLVQSTLELIYEDIDHIMKRGLV